MHGWALMAGHSRAQLRTAAHSCAQPRPANARTAVHGCSGLSMAEHS
jgi:hypothetical protein